MVGQIRDLASIGRVYDPFSVGACQGPIGYGHARVQAGGLRPRADDGFGRMFSIAECLRHNVDHTESRTDIRAEINRRLDVLYPDRRQHEHP